MNATELTLSPWRETSRVSEFRYQGTPRLTGRVRAVSVVDARLLGMAPTRPAAQALKVRPIVWSAALVERDDVIALEPSGLAALPAPPAVALEYAKAKQLPSLAVQGRMVFASRAPPTHGASTNKRMNAWTRPTPFHRATWYSSSLAGRT